MVDLGKAEIIHRYELFDYRGHGFRLIRLIIDQPVTLPFIKYPKRIHQNALSIQVYLMAHFLRIVPEFAVSHPYMVFQGEFTRFPGKNLNQSHLDQLLQTLICIFLIKQLHLYQGDCQRLSGLSVKLLLLESLLQLILVDHPHVDKKLAYPDAVVQMGGADNVAILENKLTLPFTAFNGKKARFSA